MWWIGSSNNVYPYGSQFYISCYTPCGESYQPSGLNRQGIIILLHIYCSFHCPSPFGWRYQPLSLMHWLWRMISLGLHLSFRLAGNSQNCCDQQCPESQNESLEVMNEIRSPEFQVPNVLRTTNNQMVICYSRNRIVLDYSEGTNTWSIQQVAWAQNKGVSTDTTTNTSHYESPSFQESLDGKTIGHSWLKNMNG